MNTRLSNLALAILMTVVSTVCADVYRWDNGALIPGTEGIAPGPGAPLVGQELGYANFQDRELVKADFSQSNLYRANLTNSHLNRVSFRGASLYGATFTNADLSEADLTDARPTVPPKARCAVWTDNKLLDRGRLNADVFQINREVDVHRWLTLLPALPDGRCHGI